MIYVITPWLKDVVLTCKKEGFECPVKAGRILNPNVMWIYDWQQLLGRKIRKTDKVLWGEQASSFDSQLYNKIYEEIELRKK